MMKINEDFMQNASGSSSLSKEMRKETRDAGEGEREREKGDCR